MTTAKITTHSVPSRARAFALARAAQTECLQRYFKYGTSQVKYSRLSYCKKWCTSVATEVTFERLRSQLSFQYGVFFLVRYDTAFYAKVDVEISSATMLKLNPHTSVSKLWRNLICEPLPLFLKK